MSAIVYGTYASLTVVTGEKPGTNYPLKRERPNRIGRGTDCDLTIPDPLMSRTHATIALEDGQWIVRDSQSRNGTQVNGQKVDEATVVDGNMIRVGSTELSFNESDEPLTAEDEEGLGKQTIVQDVAIDDDEVLNDSFHLLPTGEQVEELMLLHQLSMSLLGCSDPNQVIEIALALLLKRTGAGFIGYLAVTDDGKLQPKRVVPLDAVGRIRLSESLTDLVLRQGHAVWVANQSSEEGGESWEHFADAVCAPLVRKGHQAERTTLGAIHVYLEKGRFRQSDFEFIISVANQVAIALVRARELVSLQSNYQRLVEKSADCDELVGESTPMLELKSKTTRVAKTPGCVLVRGESGAGKELVARAIHNASPRADRPLVSVNCAALPMDLMESQLFGHKAGAFTGADRDHLGFFQQADQGTLFLDEVGEMTLEGQAKLLRILEGHPFLPVGGTKEIKVDVRVVAATNQDLQQYVRDKKFREDLYYRLSVYELLIPPLRDRGADIPRLINHFFDHYRRVNGRLGLQMSDGAMKKLVSYHWPGNVRQLRNVIDSAVVLAAGDTIETTDIALRDSGSDDLDTLRIDHWEKKLIVEALKRSGGSVPEAAKLLGIGRATLYRKIEQHHIDRA